MGKSSVIIVMGFLIIVGLAAPNINRMASRAYENFLSYNTRTQAHNIAVSGANIGANAIFVTPTWRSTMTDISFAGGEFTVRAENYGVDQVCVTSIGTFEEKIDTVVVILGPSSYAKFAYYSVEEGGISWVTGDTVRGPFHTQGRMNISGAPAFYGKVTARQGTNPKKSTAKFYGGYQSGVDLPLPSNFANLVAAATSGGQVLTNGDLWLKFDGDSVHWKTASSDPYTSAVTLAFAPNGVILAQSGNVHIEGRVTGKVTVSALGNSGEGNIYIDDNIQYTTDPRYGTSTDMLGLICDNNVIVTDNSANNNDVIIQASIFCRTGGFTAQNYSSRPVAGTIDLLGGIVQYQRGAVGTFTGSGGSVTITHGFRKNYNYDDRLITDSPPNYPLTGGYEMVSWYE